MPNPDLIPEPFAQSGDKNTIPLERAIADPIYRASWKAGFPPDTRLPKDLGGEGPDGLDFNGVLNILSQAVVFLQKGNAYQFDASMAPYPIGALVRSNDNLTTYQSTVPNNSNNPNSNMTGWRVYNGSGFIVDNLTTNDSAKALSAMQGKILQDKKLEATDLKDASTTQKGIVQLNNTLASTAIDQALTAAQGKVLNDQAFGVGQAWQDVTASRAVGTTYLNNTGRPIQIVISGTAAVGSISYVVLNGNSMSLTDNTGLTAIVIPTGSTYAITGSFSVSKWLELR